MALCRPIIRIEQVRATLHSRGVIMSSLTVKLIASIIGVAVVVAAAVPADAAKARKPKKVAAAHNAVRMQTGYRGANLFPAGPVYYGADYLGDDPDPFIRSQILRDASGHYGGSE
jgi:hypothetical protein